MRPPEMLSIPDCRRGSSRCLLTAQGDRARARAENLCPYPCQSTPCHSMDTAPDGRDTHAPISTQTPELRCPRSHDAGWGMGWDRMGSQQLEIGVVRVFTLTGFPFPQFASHTQRKGTWAMKEKRLRKKMKSVRSYEHHRPTYVNLIYTLWS